MTPFRRVYVQSRPATRAARSVRPIAVWHQLGGARSFAMDHAYWGPQFDAGEIDALLAERKARSRSRLHRSRTSRTTAELCRRTAGDRRRQGRRLVPGAHGMGPARARQPLDPLRSAPRRHEGILNAKIKRRESFRPFAPSVLAKLSPNGSKRTTTCPS